VNPELARYEIHDKIHFDDEHMLVDSEEDNASTEEDSDDGYLEEEVNPETKVKDYLNEIPQEEVDEINDKILNYYFDMDKMKYVSKFKGKRHPKKFAIMTYEKYMDKLKRERRNLRDDVKILKHFYPTKFNADYYEKGTAQYKYWHTKIVKENLKNVYDQRVFENKGFTPPPPEGYEDSEFAINSTPMLSKHPELEFELEPNPLKPFSRNKPKKKYELFLPKGQ
jgi:hypothetical protein